MKTQQKRFVYEFKTVIRSLLTQNNYKAVKEYYQKKIENEPNLAQDSVFQTIYHYAVAEANLGSA